MHLKKMRIRQDMLRDTKKIIYMRGEKFELLSSFVRHIFTPLMVKI